LAHITQMGGNINVSPPGDGNEAGIRRERCIAVARRSNTHSKGGVLAVRKEKGEKSLTNTKDGEGMPAAHSRGEKSRIDERKQYRSLFR